jgi:hypothetical protein
VQRTITTYVALVFIGLMTLHASVHAQLVIESPKEGDISPYRTQAVIGQTLANLPVRLAIDDLPADSVKSMPNGVFEFLGVQTHEGPVKYTVTVQFPNGRTATAERRIHILGAPDSIQVITPSREIPADGWTVVPVKARVLDLWGVQIPNGYFVTVSADSLEIQGVDADTATPGFQLRLADGEVTFGLKTAQYVGPARLVLSTDAVTARVPLRAKRPHIPLMVVASADATGKRQDVTLPAESLSSPSDFKSGYLAQGRLAGFARGTVFDDYLMTLSIDTDRKIKDQIYRDLDPNSLYSMYGDNSIVTYEAQSTSPVYAKLERDRSYLLYGDYNTLVTRNEFSGYNRSFTGGKLHTESAGYSLDLFGTVTNRKVVQEEIRGQGISGYYYLRQNNLVTGSEKVYLEVRDRFHSEVVISRKQKSRYSDYDVDYVQGTLYFKQPVPSLDDQSNPVFIVVSYEATTTSASNVVAGGAGEVNLFNNLTLGGTAVVEQRSPQNYVLAGSNLRWQLEKLGSLQGEAARSYGLGARGGAWKIEAEISPEKLFRLSPYYRKVDQTFTNPTQSGSGSERGTTKYGASFDVEPVSGTKVGGEYYEQHQAVASVSTDVQSLSGTVEQAIGKTGDVAVRVEDVKYSGLNPESASQNLSTHSTLLTGTTRTTVAEGLRASAGFEENVRKADQQVRPNSLTIGLEYDVTKAITLYGQQKFLAEQGRLTTVGLNTKVSDETSIYGKYELGGSIAGERNAATIGLKNMWKITRDLTTNIQYEKTKNLGKNLVEARTPDHDAASLSLEYFPTFPLRATAKGEYYQDVASIRRGIDVGAAFTLLDGLSLLGKGTYVLDDARQASGSVQQIDAVGGVAYRPTHSNWLNVISKVEYKAQQNSAVTPDLDYRATIASMHLYLDVAEGFELGIKYALKDSREIYDQMSARVLSHFLLLRPQYDLTPAWNVAGECRALYQRVGQNLKMGYSVETGFVFVKNTMLSAGYNFQAYRERDLVENVYSVAGPYITVRLKFTEELFGLNEMR